MPVSTNSDTINPNLTNVLASQEYSEKIIQTAILITDIRIHLAIADAL